MISDREVAQYLLARLDKAAGTVQVEQVDFVACETEGDRMAYIYYNGDECVPALFQTPPLFDPEEIERLMTLRCEEVVTLQ